MKFDIRFRFTNRVLFSCESESLKDAVEMAVKSDTSLDGASLIGASLKGASLIGASLIGASLDGASLIGASLIGASLDGASLIEASLKGASLDGASLIEASLKGASIIEASLKGASLKGASLIGASFDDNTILPTGESWRTYLSEIVPALCTAGGVSLAKVVAAWECHDWGNCPMSVAFGVDYDEQIPILLRPRANQFVHLFDAGLIPRPEVKP